jgi:hypothetical protein
MAGDEDDGLFWLSVVFGSTVCPIIETVLIGRALHSAANAHAISMKW